MPEVTATDAARNFADLLDAVERGDEFTIVRRGKAVAHLEPVRRGRGSDLKALLRDRPDDPDWAREMQATRALLRVEDRR